MPKTPTPETPEKKRPKISVLERRLSSPFGEPSVAITLKEPGWECRWFNADVATDHIWRAKHKGWEGVTPDELRDPEQIGGYAVSPDGFVTRGTQGKELLMKMPAEWRKQILDAKTEQNRKNMRPGAMRREAADAAGAQFGEEAATFVANSRVIGDVVDQREIIHRRVVDDMNE